MASIDWSRFVVVPEVETARDHTQTRDRMIEALRESGDDYATARRIADNAAKTHDRRGK